MFNISKKKILRFFTGEFYSKEFEGPFKSWDKAKRYSRGYNDKKILEKVITAVKFCQKNKNFFERDGTVIKDKKYPKKIINFLNKKYKGKTLNVLDYGGSLGSFYFQNIKKLNSIKKVSWSIVEQKSYVDTGNKIFKKKKISFFNNLDFVLKKFVPNVVLFSNSLQYIKNYEKILNKIFKISSVKHIIVDRLIVTKNNKNLIFIQKNPKHHNYTSYPIVFFSKKIFLNIFKNSFTMCLSSLSYIPESLYVKKNKCISMTYIFEKK